MSRFSQKARLAVRIWWMAGVAWWRMRTDPLPQFVTEWSRSDGAGKTWSPLKLSQIVDRVLVVGSWRPRCIVRAMVLYRLISESGYQPELVVGLPFQSDGTDTHAWIELNGHDLGPWPGRGDHSGLARFSHAGSS